MSRLLETDLIYPARLIADAKHYLCEQKPKPDAALWILAIAEAQLYCDFCFGKVESAKK